MLWMTDISFIFGGNPLGNGGKGGNGYISVGGRGGGGNPGKNSGPFSGLPNVGGRVSMDILRPLLEGLLFHM